MRVSNVEDIPKYWHGTRSLEITERNEDGVRARMRFAFGGSGDAEIKADASRRALTVSYVSGPFRGVQEVVVTRDEVAATWDVKFTGAFRLLSGWNESHFRSGTKHALERLIER